ncbi:hypothetical protein BB559_006750 [Furculomyces boomerangus]|uniref:Mitochondrial resolvase Ydc2 catalytic domain-containing protein n=1 Tax=Furculomyces boomerangus TaxID=61424 RepID=A0A2T9Y0J8_9FUNG|nr:hypothetical protein BB559_006792 [Furculomyces boomerangus]PVU85946.1 hypothetical protein BB559_006750 [Furculomyces boomerangus]
MYRIVCRQLSGKEAENILRQCGLPTTGLVKEKKDTLEERLDEAQKYAIKKHLLGNDYKELSKSRSCGDLRFKTDGGCTKETIKSLDKFAKEISTLENVKKIYSELVPEYLYSIDIGYKNLGLCKITRDMDILKWERVALLETSTFDSKILAQKVEEFVGKYIEWGDVGRTSFVVERQQFRFGSSHSVLNSAIINGMVEALIFSNILRLGGNDIHSVLPTSSIIGEFEANKRNEPNAKKWEVIRRHTKGITNPGTKSGVYRKELLDFEGACDWMGKDLHSFGNKESFWRDKYLHEKKKDDLADSFLQAIAWLYWQNNKASILGRIYEEHQFLEAIKSQIVLG